MDNFHRPIISKEIEISSLNLATKISPGKEVFSAESCQTIKENPRPAQFTLFCEVQKQGIYLNSIYKDSLTQMPKLEKDPTKKNFLSSLISLYKTHTPYSYSVKSVFTYRMSNTKKTGKCCFHSKLLSCKEPNP